MYASDHDGASPATLDAAARVPMPKDPGTGRPFDDWLDGETAVLSLPGKPEMPPTEYRLSIREN